MFYVLIGLIALVYGVFYAVNPMPTLKKKFGEDEVPKWGVTTARVSGVVLAVVGIVVIVINLMKELG